MRSLRPAPVRPCRRIRLGSRATLAALWKPPRRELPPPSALACAGVAASTRVPSWTVGERRFVLRRARTRTQRPRTRDAIRAVRAPIQRVEASMLPPTVTRHHRWMETMFRRSMQSRDSARRHEACCGDARPFAARCSEPIRPAPPEGGSRSDKPAPTAEARSSLRGPLTAHPAEMLEDVATSGLLTPLDRMLARPATRTAAGAGDR